MNTYLLFPLTSGIVCLVLSAVILVRDSTRRVSRLAALLTAVSGYWALCEVVWNGAWNEDVALSIIRMSGFGWIAVGPLTLHLFLELTSHSLRTRRFPIAILYASAILLMVLDALSPWIHASALRMDWGWSYEVGPLFPIAYLFTVSTLIAGLILGFREFHGSVSSGVRLQAYTFMGGLTIPLIVGSVTDGILPIAGIHVPHFGATSITLLAGTIAWSFYRFGYSLLAPGVFASEILATLHDGVVMLRLDSRIHSVNPGMERLTGESAFNLEGRFIRELVDHNDLEKLQEISECECTLRSHSGDVIPVSISTLMLRDKRETVIGQVLVVRDLREVASLRSRLITSGRLASVGELAAGIAHEINTPIAYVRANLGALCEMLESVVVALPDGGTASLRRELHEGRELVEESLEGIDRVAAIVRDVKGFSHAGEGATQIVDLEPLLESVLRVAAPQIRHLATVACDYRETPPVWGAPQELKQVFLNLVINASQAVDPGDSIWLRVHAEGDRVIVEVEDDGCGIPEEMLERIFDPFFTTKPVGVGTGLGLSISYEIVRKHGGEITVSSKPGQGTCFRVSLPAADLGSD